MPQRNTNHIFDDTIVIIKGKNISKSSHQRNGNINISSKDKKKDERTKMQKLENENEKLKHDKIPTELKMQIQKARISKGWNQQELAMKLQINKKIIIEYENGKAIPKGAELSKIKKILGYENFK